MAVRIALRLKRREAVLSLSQLNLRRCHARHQFGAAFFIVTTLGMRPIRLQLELAQALPVLADLGFDGVAALGSLRVLGLELLNIVSVMTHLIRNGIDLRIQRSTLLIKLRKLAGQHQSKFGPHLFAQLGIAFSFRSLPLERVHLPRHFLENVIHSCQVLFGIFQPRFSQAFLSLEFCNAGSFFDDGPAIGWTAA